MNTPIQLFFICVGVLMALKSISQGLAVGTLPAGWFFAEDAENSVYVWLGACLVWGLSLVFLLRAHENARDYKKQLKR